MEKEDLGCKKKVEFSCENLGVNFWVQTPLWSGLTSPDSPANTPQGLWAEVSHKPVMLPSPSVMGKEQILHWRPNG